MVEETEHKTAAFDAHMAYRGRYLPKLVGLLQGSLRVSHPDIPVAF